MHIQIDYLRYRYNIIRTGGGILIRNLCLNRKQHFLAHWGKDVLQPPTLIGYRQSSPQFRIDKHGSGALYARCRERSPLNLTRISKNSGCICKLLNYARIHAIGRMLITGVFCVRQYLQLYLSWADCATKSGKYLYSRTRPWQEVRKRLGY